MTFPSSGTTAHAQSVLGITPARVTTTLPLTPTPVELYHSARNGETIPNYLLNLYNVIYTMTALTYRM